jgi:hypothetical protein
MPASEQNLRDKVDALKESHVIWRHKVNRSMIAWGLAGIAIGLVVWLTRGAADRDGEMFGVVFTLGISVFVVGCLLGRLLLPKPQMTCPRCQCNWAGSDPTDDWLSWHCCPGCGLEIGDPDA